MWSKMSPDEKMDLTRRTLSSILYRPKQCSTTDPGPMPVDQMSFLYKVLSDVPFTAIVFVLVLASSSVYGQWEQVLKQVQEPQVKELLKPDLDTYTGHPSIEQAIRDGRSYWYNDKNVPRVFLDDFARIYPATYKLDSRTKAGNPNNQAPWKTNGGLDNVRHTSQRLLWIPPGKKIKLRTRNRPVAFRTKKRFRWTGGNYPNSSYVAEFMYSNGRLFEIRSRHKVQGKWEVDEQFTIGDHPKGYKAVDNCKDCHSDIGKNAQQLRNRGVNYRYGTISGLEVGGPIRFHPWKIRSNRVGYRTEIRDDVKHLVEWVQ